MPLNTPVVFCIFRRPETTRRVFERIAQAQPRQLFVIADGPRNPEEAALCEQTRAIVQVDWPCEVRYNYAEQNMGLKARISSGLDWVFEQVEQAIVLEDDCLPHSTFFRFCEELLEYYRDDERVMHISGDNFGYQRPPGCTDSYYFSRYAHIWGWATWRRAWAKYDVEMRSWPNERVRAGEWFDYASERRYWIPIFEAVAAGRIHTWDYQWLYACLRHKGLCIMPFENQVSNIGMSGSATNTRDEHSPVADLPTSAISFPLIHPSLVRHERRGERIAARLFWMHRVSLLHRLHYKFLLLWRTR